MRIRKTLRPSRTAVVPSPARTSVKSRRNRSRADGLSDGEAKGRHPARHEELPQELIDVRMRSAARIGRGVAWAYPAGLSTGEACLNGRHLMAGPSVTRQRCVA